MKRFFYGLLSLVMLASVAVAVTGVDTTLQYSEMILGKLKVGNGTADTATGDEDAYIEGDFEVDGTLNADGASDFDGSVELSSTFTIDGTTINEVALKYPGRGSFRVCGDATTVNNNTVYYGPSNAVVSSATIGLITCNTTAAGSTTEATADAPVFTAQAFVVLGMQCWSVDPNTTLTFTARSAEAGLTPALSVSIADNALQGMASAPSTTAIASGATFAVAVASTADVGAVPFICEVNVAY